VIDRAPPADPATLGRWRARLDALTRWCLSDAPLAPSAAAVAGGTRPTLGDLLRRALARAGDGVVDLLDALDDPDAPAHRARLARVLGGDVLLVVVTARGGAVAGAEARSARAADEARALMGAFLGGAVPPWMAASGAHVRDALAGPLLITPLDGGAAPGGHGALARLLGDPAVESTLVFPLLALDGEAPGVPAPAPEMLGMPEPGSAAPTVLGGVLRPGAAFLDAPAIGPFIPMGDPEDDAEADDAADEPENDVGRAADVDLDADLEDDADDAEEGDDAGMDDVPAVLLAEPAPPAFVAAVAEQEEDAAPEEVSSASQAALERLRARRGPVDRVSVVVTSDDGEAEHLGDAAPWLEAASEQELRALARAGWSGEAAVELALAADDPEVEDVARQARRNEAELVVEIDPDEAVTWLRRHRPETADWVEAVL
jgi:hypothetical protein